MSKEVYDKIVLAAQNNKSICINVNEFIDLLKSKIIGEYDIKNFNPITTKEILETGLWAKIGKSNCFVSSVIAPGFIRVSDLENPPATSKILGLKLPLLQEEENIRQYWSAEMPLAEYKKE